MTISIISPIQGPAGPTGPTGPTGPSGVVSSVSSTQSGTTYTLALADKNTLIYFTNGSAIALTVPTNGSVAFAVDDEVHVCAFGAGQITVAGAVTVTVDSQNGLKSAGQYAVFTLKKQATNVWIMFGNTTT